MTGYVSLDAFDLALAALLLVVNGLVSLRLGLRLERQLAVAAIRMIVQLLLVGMILKALFATVSPWLTLLVAVVMAGFAAHEIRARQERQLTGWWTVGIGGTPMALVGLLITMLALVAVIGPDPWYHPQYAIPLFGMVLGNSMTGVALGLNTLTTTVIRERAAVEAQLMLGATIWTAARPTIRTAMKSAFMPVINSMAATGVVFLPGMMTGQILAGVDPGEAVKYQLLVMFLIAGSTGSGIFISIYGAVWRLSDDRHRLRLDRFAPVPKEQSQSNLTS
jgi:putative ABC transport system permease protein